MPLSPGQILNDRYCILKLFGQGGFGAVYQAWDINMDRLVALKENLDTTPQAQRQFYREAQILFDLSHPNLPRVMDHFVVPNQGQYLMMEYIEGQDLREMLIEAGGPLLEAQVLPWIDQICDALIYLHSQNPPIIHRDIKPANIKITPKEKAVLVDFGIAKSFDPKLRSTSGARVVTPGYSPLEQYDQEITDVQSDVYALGATLYHLLTGIKPPASVNIAAEAVPPPLPARLINPTISPLISSSIEKAMQLEKKNRWTSVVDFKEAFTASFTPVKLPSPVSAELPEGSEVISALQGSQSLQPSAPVVKRTIHWSCQVVVGVLTVIVITFVVLSIGNLGIYGNKIPTMERTTEVLSILLPSYTPELTSTKSSIPTTTSTNFTDELGVLMRLIPSGIFQMGSENGQIDERPIHTIYLDAFYMDIHEVTNTMYAACVKAGVCIKPGCDHFGNSTYDNHPVVCVNWEQANKYCEWRGARLPTEGEWEKASSGGKQGKLYPWGDSKPECSRSNYDGCVGDTVNVSSYAPNGYGLLDMAGNVWEWVADCYTSDYYTISPMVNPPGPPCSEPRVIRGGSWNYLPIYARITYRNWYYPGSRVNFIGFRCARSP
jgi:formylglycine-generating enzyme required for sulfatase activity